MNGRGERHSPATTDRLITMRLAEPPEPFDWLRSESDLQAVGDAISPGSLAGIMVYENAWAAQIMQEIDDSGVRLLGSARIQTDDILAALESITIPKSQPD